MAYYPSRIPFIRTDPDKPFDQQVKDAVVIDEVRIERDQKDTRPPLVFSRLYLKKGVKIAETNKQVQVGDPVELK